MMANIATSIQLYDRVSAPINNMLGAINRIIYAFESVESSMDGAFNTAEIDAAKAHIQQAKAQMIALGDEIDNNRRSQSGFTNEVKNSQTAVDGLVRSAKNLIGAYAGLQGAQKLINLSDEYARTNARLKMIVDEQSNVEELQSKIYAAAQRSRSSYADTADMVAKISMRTGDLFSNNEAIVFAENLNKMYKIAGASQEEMRSSQLQLLQALGSGVLRGEEFNAVFEAAPNVMQAIADSMNVPISKLREMAKDGEITADIVKNAMLNIPEDTLKDFNNMPMTWAEVWTMTLNKLYMISQPLLSLINLLANNWSILEPIILGVAAAVGMYLLATKGVVLWQTITNGVMTAFKAIQTFVSIGWGVLTGNTAAASAAQFVYNSALMACPLFWIIMLLILLITIICTVVAIVNKATGSSISAIGVVVGVLTAAVSVVWNIFLMLLNFIIQSVVVPLTLAWDTFANFFGNILNDPAATCIRTIESMASAILGILQTIANGIDSIFGSNLSGAVSGWMSKVSGWADKMVDKYGNGSYEEKSNITEQVQGFLNDAQAKFSWDTGSAFNTGYGWGAGIGDAVSGMFNMGDVGKTLDIGDVGAMPGGGTLDDIGKNTGKTADNTEKAAKSLELTQEDLKYLRDIAERDVINRFTTAEIKVDMKNTNNINSNMDLDGIIDHLVVGVNEAMEKAAEGVHV